MNPQLLNAEDLGMRLEIAGNLPIWEASPLCEHQKEVDRSRDSFRKNEKEGDSCNCIDAANVYVQFPDGSLKRPDIRFSYEAKDLEISPPIYLANGVKDVVVFNPYTKEIVHFRLDETLNLNSPVEIELACGCSCTV